MTTLYTNPISLPDSSDVDLDEPVYSLDPERPSHLILLLPANLDYTAVLSRVCRLAKETNLAVLLLSLYRDATEELALRRELVTVSALLREDHVRVEMRTGKGTNWVEVIRENYQMGDIIVCIAEQPTGILRRPLSQILESSLHAPVYILSGFSLRSRPDLNWLSGFMRWAGSISIIAGAFFLQIQIVSMAVDWAQTILLILTVIVEIGLIGVWNSLFG